MLKYRYALCNVWWNKTAQDQPLFFDDSTMQQYFDSVRTEYSPLFNFSIGDSVSTQIFIQVDNLPTNEVLDKHYLIIQEYDEENEQVVKEYHYFAEISQDSGNQYYCVLERDVIIDYYILGDVRNRAYTMLYRTHLDRFVYEDNEFKFNGKNDSPLFISENIETDNSLNVKTTYIDTQSNLESNYRNHPLWIYVYLNLPDDNAFYNPYFENGINQGFTLFVFPYGNQNSIIKNGDNEYDWNIISFLESQPYLLPYIINIRISPSSPFGNVDDVNCPIGYSERRVGGLLTRYESIYNVTASPTHGTFTQTYVLNTYTYNDTNYYFISIKFDTFVEKQHNTAILKDLLNYDISLTKNLIIGGKDYKKEPKLYNGIIKGVINFGITEGNEYNLLNLLYNKNKEVDYRLKESLVPGITRVYHGLVCDDSIYNESNFNNLKQNNSSIDTSIPFSVNQLETFLSQNKNFYQSASLSRNSKMLESTVGGIVNGFSKGGVGGAIIGGLTSGAGTAYNNYVDYRQQEYKIDNLKSAPTDIRNLEGNPLLGISMVGLRPRFEVWQPLQSNLEKIADYLFFNGYNYNKIGKLADFDKTRKYFNFIQGDINGICYNMNDKAYSMLREKLLVGVRFWHVKPCDVNFDEVDNYELFIDNIEE